MRSTGEVMGQDEDSGIAFAKTQMAAKPSLPLEGNVFLSVKDSDKEKALLVARGLSDLGFSFYSTEGTAAFLQEHGIEAESVLRISEGRPNVADLIKNGKIHLVINTPLGLIPRRDENGIQLLLCFTGRIDPVLLQGWQDGFMSAEAMCYMLTNTSIVRKMFSFSVLNGNVL